MFWTWKEPTEQKSEFVVEFPYEQRSYGEWCDSKIRELRLLGNVFPVKKHLGTRGPRLWEKCWKTDGDFLCGYVGTDPGECRKMVSVLFPPTQTDWPPFQWGWIIRAEVQLSEVQLSDLPVPKSRCQRSLTKEFPWVGISWNSTRPGWWLSRSWRVHNLKFTWTIHPPSPFQSHCCVSL
jgi:hypothetical protein